MLSAVSNNADQECTSRGAQLVFGFRALLPYDLLSRDLLKYHYVTQLVNTKSLLLYCTAVREERSTAFNIEALSLRLHKSGHLDCPGGLWRLQCGVRRVSHHLKWRSTRPASSSGSIVTAAVCFNASAFRSRTFSGVRISKGACEETRQRCFEPGHTV